MDINFIKMHGCGNDYIYIDCMEKEANFNIEEVSKKLSDRHFGVGGDGLVLICKSDKADAYMKMFNADGTQGKMCGNAIRCVSKYLYEEGIVKNKTITIETLSGIKTLYLDVEKEKVKSVTVNMGVADFNPTSMPIRSEDEVILKEIEVEGRKYKVSCVSMGNPHCVVFLDEIKNLDVNSLGPKFYENNLFKDEVNIEFVKVISKNEVDMRVHERGSKETLACGTGACAVVSVLVKTGMSEKGEDVTVNLIGGKLKINSKEDGVYMTGPATEVFRGKAII